MDLGDVALGVFLVADALYDIGILQAHLAVGFQTEVLLGRILHKVGALDIHLTGERNAAERAVGLLGIERRVEPFHFALFPVVNHQLNRVNHGHVAVRAAVQVVADAPFEQREVDDVVALGHAHLLRKGADALRRIAAAAQTADGRHARVVPAVHIAVLHEFQHLTLAHHGVGEVQAREFVLVRREDLQFFDEPVVERPVHVEFQRADGVGDILDRIGLAVGIVVHRVDAPLVAGAVVVCVDDAVHQWIAEEHVRVGHVNLGAKHAAAVRELARLHPAEEVQVLLHAAVAPRALYARLAHRAAILADLLLRLVVYIGQTLLNEHFRPFVELVKIVGSVELIRPLEAEPLDILLDGVYVFGVFLDGVRVVEAQVGGTAVLLREAEV